MRLTPEEIKKIKGICLTYDPHVEIYLYGSRVDDQAKGGDIDLLLISQTLTFDDKIKIKWKLYEVLGEQKIDLTIAKDQAGAFVQVILEKGILL